MQIRLLRRGATAIAALALTASLVTPAPARALRAAETFVDVAGIVDLLARFPGDHRFLAGMRGLANDLPFDSVLGELPEVVRVRNVLLDPVPPTIDFLTRGDVGANFGVPSRDAVTVGFDLASWVTPAPDPASYDDAVLVLLAFDPQRLDAGEAVFTEAGPVRRLRPGSGFTVSFDALGNLAAALGDDGLATVSIRPRGMERNTIQILGARLAASFEATGAPAVPEPGAALGFAAALVLLGLRFGRARS